MILHLNAWSPRTGWAYAEGDGRAWLLRPPYSIQTRVELPQTDGALAVARLGLLSPRSPQAFTSWPEVVAFLRQELVHHHPSIADPLSDEEEERDLLQLAPAPIVQEWLDRVRSELLPEHRYEQAQAFLSALITKDTVAGNKLLLAEVASLLDQVNALRSPQARQLAEDSFSWESRFPFAVSSYGLENLKALSERLYNSHQVFPM